MRKLSLLMCYITSLHASILLYYFSSICSCKVSVAALPHYINNCAQIISNDYFSVFQRSRPASPAAWLAESTGSCSGRRGGWNEWPCWWQWPCTAWGGSCPPGAGAMHHWTRLGTASSHRPMGTHWACPKTSPPAVWSTAPCAGCPNQTAPCLTQEDVLVKAQQFSSDDAVWSHLFTLWFIEQRELRINGSAWEGWQTEEVFLQQGDVGLLVYRGHVLSEGNKEEDATYFL